MTERPPCPTTGKPMSECRDWKEIDCHPWLYEPTMEGGMEQCNRCGMHRYFSRERSDAAAQRQGDG